MATGKTTASKTGDPDFSIDPAWGQKELRKFTRYVEVVHATSAITIARYLRDPSSPERDATIAEERAKMAEASAVLIRAHIRSFELPDDPSEPEPPKSFEELLARIRAAGRPFAIPVPEVQPDVTHKSLPVVDSEKFEVGPVKPFPGWDIDAGKFEAGPVKPLPGWDVDASKFEVGPVKPIAGPKFNH